MAGASADPPQDPHRRGCALRVEVLGRLPEGVRGGDLRRVLRGAGACLRLGPAGVAVRFAGDRTVRALNLRYRGVDRPTDVLSFPLGEDPSGRRELGDILISRDRARRQALRSGIGIRREVEELALHGLLHLLGHDHVTDHGEMDRLELALRRRLLDRRPRRGERGR
jgi:probable rRNA maturation factor